MPGLSGGANLYVLLPRRRSPLRSDVSGRLRAESVDLPDQPRRCVSVQRSASTSSRAQVGRFRFMTSDGDGKGRDSGMSCTV